MKKWVIIGCLGAMLLLGITAAAYYMHRSDGERISELEIQLSAMSEREKQSEVVRGVSEQMEEIAYGQQLLSEERSEEVIRQFERAQAATLRSEAERRKALHAQAAAEASAEEALISLKIAEKQRIAAEHAKLVADTLNYISLGRTLGSQSYTIYQAGDTELGNMLAYASYLFTSKYGGDLYTSSVFGALTQSAGGRRNWSVHNGCICAMDFFPHSERLLTASVYGEIFNHEMKAGNLVSRCLFRNKDYVFRDAFASTAGKSYAISHTGHLVVVGHGGTKIIPIDNVTKPFALKHLNNGRQLLIVGEKDYALLDIATDEVIGTRKLDFHVVCTSKYDDKPVLFDDRGNGHIYTDFDKLKTFKVPVSGHVTAFAFNKNERLFAYGMADGTIWLVDRSGKSHKLVGHLSQISKVKFNGRRLYSSSYDGRLLFWKTDDMQIKPITLFRADSWLMDFTFDIKEDYIWTGDEKGVITEYLISLPKIAQRLRQNVKRNFTQEEWNYYVGKGIQYVEVNSEK